VQITQLAQTIERTEGAAQACVRARFSKLGASRYLSHLDLMKCFERALRRTGLPVSYTEGFHPRIRLAFGPALALGHASSAEWLDLELARPCDVAALTQAINASLPAGLELLEVRAIPLHAPSLQKICRRAEYKVIVEVHDLDGDAAEHLRASLRGLLAQQEITVQKKNKTAEVRGLVAHLEYIGSVAQWHELAVHLLVGPEGSVRPEELLAHLLPHVMVLSVERTALLQAVGRDQWAEPWPPQTAS
jgi:radical SAM-linked protein